MAELTLKDILDLGTNGLLVVFLWLLWQRLNYVTDFLIKDRIEAQAERRAIARQAGLTTQDLRQEAKSIRQQLENEKSS